MFLSFCALLLGSRPASCKRIRALWVCTWSSALGNLYFISLVFRCKFGGWVAGLIEMSVQFGHACDFWCSVARVCGFVSEVLNGFRRFLGLWVEEAVLWMLRGDLAQVRSFWLFYSSSCSRYTLEGSGYRC